MRSIAQLLIVISMLFILAACTGTKSTNTADVGGEQIAHEEPNIYYDFDDILVPKEMSYAEDESYKLDNAKFTASIMKFSGRVKVMELVNFFINEMAKDNWAMTSNNKAGKLSQLSFEKHNKSAVIQVDDSFGSATATIIAIENKTIPSGKAK